MKIVSFQDEATYGEKGIAIKVLLESSFSKEIRILMKEGQVMKEHKTAFPIIVHILDGEIDFGVNGQVHNLHKGNMITLEGNVPHDLTALHDSTVRLTLSKLDSAERVEKVASQSSPVVQ